MFVRALATYLDRQLLSAAPVAEQRRWWAIKIRAMRILADSHDPEALAERILTVLTAPMRRAA